MKWVVLIFFLPILAFAEKKAGEPVVLASYLEAFLATDASSSSTESFYEHIQKLESKRNSFRTEESFLRYVFNKTHSHFLKDFQAYTSFGQLLDKGKYNCLTATALYALILEQLGVQYEIIETNYHIFILAHATDSGSAILLETTDPIEGFVSEDKEIENRITKYKQNTISETKAKKDYYKLSCNLYARVELDEVVGLLHYNLAIASFNNQRIDDAIKHLDKATLAYSSPRMEELTRILLLSVVESNLDAESKERSIKTIQTVRKRNLMALASVSSQQ